MSSGTLAALQDALADIYDLPATPDIAEYLLTDRARLAAMSDRVSDEQLLVAEDGDTVSLALYIDAAVLERLERRDPFAALTHENLADYMTAAEGVSHFVYVAWNAGHDKPVTLLELELQAEIDKYVLGAWLLREQCGRFPRELHRVLFDRAPRAFAQGREQLAARGVAAILSPGKRAQARAHRTLRVKRSRAAAATTRRRCRPADVALPALASS